MIPDRLPSLIVLVGFWIPPAAAGWVAAALQRRSKRGSARVIYVVLATFVLGYERFGFSSTSAACRRTYPEHRPIQRSRRRRPSRVLLLSRVRWCCPAARSPACWRFAAADGR